MSDYRRRAVIASEGGGGTIAPDFSTATWAEIQAYINENGTADYAEQVGKTRPVTLSDSSAHTLRLVNATGDLYELADGSAYTGFVVEFVDCVRQTMFSSSGNANGALATIDPIGTTVLPSIKTLLPNDLKNVLATVKVIKANAYNDGTLVSSNMDLFIPTVKEIAGSFQNEVTEEANAMTWWGYYETHHDRADLIKYDSTETARTWLTRSPSTDSYGRYVCNISYVGSASEGTANFGAYYVSPCFCLAKQPPTPTSFAVDDWETIQYAIDHDLASSVYSVGDTKTITLSDNSTHTLRIANMDGNLYELSDGSGYTGMVVEFATIIGAYSYVQFKSTANNSGALGSIDPMGTTTLPAIISLLPQDLQNILPTVKVVRADGGNATTLATSDMKLFIPSATEVHGITDMGVPEVERNALTQWAYYANGGNVGKRVNGSGNYSRWWLRSAYTGNTVYLNVVNNTSADVREINSAGGVSPCFCLAKTPPTPPDFSTASWSDIQAYIDEYGTNGFADQVGATREITLSDSSTHTLRLANATGNLYELADSSGYTGFIVEFADIVDSAKVASNGTFVGPLGNNDPLGTTTLPAIQATLPQELQSILANVKVVTITSYNDNTLVSSNMKLFIPSINEILGSTGGGYASNTELNISARWKYYTDNDSYSYRQKYKAGSLDTWWLRSPVKGSNSSMCNIAPNGNISTNLTDTTRGVSPCFCLAPTPSAPTPTPTSFADDDWATIKYAVDNNLASAVYSVGDTKTITLSDSSTHTLRIANITGNLYEYADNAGTYTGFVMEFADVPLLNEFAVPSSGSPGALDTIDPIGTTVLPNIEAMLPSNMASVLSMVKVLKSTSGTTKALISADMKLFLPAERELFGTRAHSTTNEWNAFSRWEYYATNDTTAARTKLYKGTQNMPYWLRSPESDASTRIVRVTNGSSDIESPATSAGISPCFCI